MCAATQIHCDYGEQSHIHMHTQRGADAAHTMIHSVVLLSGATQSSSLAGRQKGSRLSKAGIPVNPLA